MKKLVILSFTFLTLSACTTVEEEADTGNTAGDEIVRCYIGNKAYLISAKECSLRGGNTTRG